MFSMLTFSTVISSLGAVISTKSSSTPSYSLEVDEMFSFLQRMESLKAQGSLQRPDFDASKVPVGVRNHQIVIPPGNPVLECEGRNGQDPVDRSRYASRSLKPAVITNQAIHNFIVSLVRLHSDHGPSTTGSIPMVMTFSPTDVQKGKNVRMWAIPNLVCRQFGVWMMTPSSASTSDLLKLCMVLPATPMSTAVPYKRFLDHTTDLLGDRQ